MTIVPILVAHYSGLRLLISRSPLASFPRRVAVQDHVHRDPDGHRVQHPDPGRGGALLLRLPPEEPGRRDGTGEPGEEHRIHAQRVRDRENTDVVDFRGIFRGRAIR